MIKITFLVLFLLPSLSVYAGEANLKIPVLNDSQQTILLWGFVVCFLGVLFGLYQFLKVKKLKAHQSMLDIAQIIFETCKTYLVQQGKLLIVLFIFIAVCISFYFG
jgi:K(+)-stimulated pyrophosphate-energized sodium pump